mmetsp:Transcript_59426/g.140466  ORF Transcript_59426/g.140466 Transcript_59426/m.140466 type:complete len:548 (-) Transcript_59426:2329-3972(-)
MPARASRRRPTASAAMLPRGFLLPASALEIAQAEVFHLDIVLDALAPAFAAEAGLLDAAEGHFGRRDQAGVDAHHAVLQRLADAEDAADVAAVEVAGEAEFGGIGQLDDIGLGLELEHRRHRAEGLLARAQHLRCGVGEQGRLEEAAAGAFDALAAGQQLGAERNGVGDMGLHLLQRLLVDQRADVDARLEAVARPQRRNPGRKLLQEGVVDACLHIDAVGADAGLAGIAVLAGDGAFDGRIEVCIVKHDEGRVAAQFQAELLDRRRALLHQDPADLGAAGEGQVFDDLALAEDAADFDGLRGIGRQHVQHAGRHAGALGQLGHGQGGQRRGLGGLDDDRAARSERRCDLARDHRKREVPRRDRRTHTHGLLDHKVALGRVGGGNRLAVDPLALLGKPVQEARAVNHLTAGLGQRLALFGGHQPGQVVGMLHQQLLPAQQHRSALLGRLGPPGVQGIGGGGDRGLGLGAAQVGHLGQFAAGGRVGHGKAGRTSHPFAVDQGLGAQQAGVVERGQRGICFHLGVSNRMDGDSTRDGSCPLPTIAPLCH